MSRAARRASGFTLIELLVTISIIVVLMTLVAIYVVPAFSDNKNVIRGADRVVTTLLIAKQRAFRDARPMGVRFDIDAATTFCRTLRYVEQPEPISPATVTLTNGSQDVPVTGIDLVGSGNAVARDLDNWQVQPGDWLRVTELNRNFEIVDVGPNLTVIPPLAANTVRVRNAPSGLPVSPYTARLSTFVRQTRPIVGEDTIELPMNVGVDISTVGGSRMEGGQASFTIPNPATPPVPPRIAPYLVNQVPGRSSFDATQAIFEVVFDPAGGVSNRPNATPILILVRDETRDWRLPQAAVLIGINPRTGAVSTHQVDQSQIATNPFGFALDGRASGL